MNEYLSKKIRILSFISILLVVLLHSFNVGYQHETNILPIQSLNDYIQFFFSQGITRIAVPLFFLISGYLFYQNIHKGSLFEFQKKYKSRFNSLLVPYIFWSVFSLVFYIVVAKLVHHPIPNKILFHIFVEPMAFQLWFVRDLVILVIISPIIYYLTKWFKSILIILLIVLWLTLKYFIPSLSTIICNEPITDDIYTAIVFFCIGAYLAIHKQNILLTRHANSNIYIYIWIILLIAKTTLLAISFSNTYIIFLLHQISIIIGIIAVWNLYDIICEKTFLKKYYWLTSYTFFIYVFHEPLQSFLKKAYISIAGKGNISLLICYFLTPIIAITISIIVAHYLKKLLPKFYCVITGKR